ncbi:tetratricopeptide repeat protein [Flavobacteriaceae bacterium]|nr:tetratricopeptide repeat protein [Flavobacteriaceae bacterium]
MNSYNCKFLIILFIFIGSINGQSYDDASEASKLCLLAQGSFGDNFTNDKDADISLEKILSVIGASKRFILQPCSDINNAVATSYKGLRYILYDKSFMSTIANNSTAWSKLFILAHEVGHHINGHSIDILLAAADVVEPKTLATKRQQELESDEFAGFILGKLGANLEQTSEAINLLASNKDDTYSSHPTKAKRLNAIKIGFNKALGKEQVSYEEKSNLNTAEEYFYRGYDKSDKGDYYGAITDFTKAIEINPNLANAYFTRGNAKYNLKDYNGAIADYTIAIEINPNFAIAYYNRGNIKEDLKDYNGAIADYTKAIEINPNYDEAYNNRGLSKTYLKDYYGAISDYTKALEINPNDAARYFNIGNAKTYLNDYYGAISDFTKAIEINPNYTDAYFNRGLSKKRLKDYYGAISDYTKIIEINPNDALAYRYRGNTNIDLKDYYGAISDYTKAIEINPNDAASYFNRGLGKYWLDDYNGACIDARKAQDLGSDATQIINIVCK